MGIWKNVTDGQTKGQTDKQTDKQLPNLYKDLLEKTQNN